MGVKHKIRNPKCETIWKFKIPNFQNRGFGGGWPEIRATFKAAPPSTELRTGSIIRAICVFDAKKGLDSRFPILVTRYQQGR